MIASTDGHTNGVVSPKATYSFKSLRKVYVEGPRWTTSGEVKAEEETKILLGSSVSFSFFQAPNVSFAEGIMPFRQQVTPHKSKQVVMK